jgi:hypothetical protein
MSRTISAVNRVVALLLGLTLIAVGAGALAWSLDVLPRIWSQSPESLNADGIESATATSWWPWACAAAGVLLAVVALAWLVALLRPTRHGPEVLPGSDGSGTLTADPVQAGEHVARLMSEHPDVLGARARGREQRGRRVLDLTTTIDARADLMALRERATELVGELGAVTGEGQVDVRHRLRVASRQRARRARVS